MRSVEVLRELVEFALRQGYHELGYDPVDALQDEVLSEVKHLILDRDAARLGRADEQRNRQKAEAECDRLRKENERLQTAVDARTAGDEWQDGTERTAVLLTPSEARAVLDEQDELERLRRLEAAVLDHGGWDRKTSPGARLMDCIAECRASECRSTKGGVMLESVLERLERIEQSLIKAECDDLRDRFAMAVAPGLIVSIDRHDMETKFKGMSNERMAAQIAFSAYDLADAFMAERMKRKAPAPPGGKEDER